MRPVDSPQTRPDVAKKTAHLLVVDDEPQIRELVATALRREGYRVTVQPDAETALEILRTEDVHLLLTDLKMPRMNGLDLIRAARRMRPGIGSILITAYSSTETAVQALRTGADDYLTKPFRLEALRATADRVLRTRRMMDDEQAAVALVRSEASELRERNRRTTEDLARTKATLQLSRRDLEHRVRDLDFVRELSGLLARKGDLQRMLQTTTSILSRRFQALVTRIELQLGDDMHVAEDVRGSVPSHVLSTMGPDLIHRARAAGGTLSDIVLGFGRPMEGLAAALDVGGLPVGGLTLLRPVNAAHDAAGDHYLLGLVPQTLGVALESELNRLAAEQNALQVALSMLDTLEGRGSLYAGHSRRVARIAGEISGALGLSPRLRGVVETAARLHDVGEVGVPDGVLQREGPLSSAEQDLVRMHPVIGARILAPFGEASAFVRHHHERPDGRGYPDGLAGDDIPLGAGIIGVAEAFEAMTSARPYRPSRSRKEAMSEIERLKGAQFVADAVDGLLTVPGDRL